MDLRSDHFSEFFYGIHGQPPFPWQIRLARKVVESGRWPALLDLPTGSGKTAALDIAVFHLACEADRGPERKAPVRILFVIDRRIVVDATFERARKIAKALREARVGVVAAVAERLQALGGTGVPLHVVRLRGGMPQERDWVRSPVQPTIVVSTVDQVGSRLLFRGYGVSTRMWPVHAGLVGADALWLLDEVHLSVPLEETLAAIEAGHSPDGGGVMARRPRLAPFAVVRLSATPGAQGSGEVFRLDEDDRRHEVLQRRLAARKLTALEEFECDPCDAFVERALAFAGLAVNAGTKGKTGAVVEPVRRIAVVVNRVDLARRIHEKVSRAAEERADVLLLTGRVRPLDREAILKKLKPLFAIPFRPDVEKPIIVVATQAIEVGADLDFDALITEIAPLDSLRQRFGRLDRLGSRGTSRAVILCSAAKPPARGEKSKNSKDNPWTPLFRIYGEAVYATKEWLVSLGDEIDFGAAAMEERLASLEEGELAKLLAPRRSAPVLFPPYVDIWASTTPAPAATPEPSLFLHGPAVVPDVQVVWRADPNRVSLNLCPPSALEAIQVPVWALHRWLGPEREQVSVSDVPEEAPVGDAVTSFRGDAIWRWDGEKWEETNPDEIRPGDMIVVPASWGGCDEWGWNPRSREAVADLGAEAHYLQRQRGAVCLTPETLANVLQRNAGPEGASATRELWRQIAAVVADMGDEVDARLILEILLADERLPETWRKLLQGIGDCQPRIAFCDDSNRERGFVLFARTRLDAGLMAGEAEEGEGGAEAVTGYDNSSFVGREVRLKDHLARVERLTRRFASRAGLDERHIHLLGLAGRLHDVGKADPRFQADLRGTSALAAADPHLAIMLVNPQELLAKSAVGDLTGSFRFPRAVPEHFRHEALSVAMAARHPEVAALDVLERDLVLWLIGTHHGFGRPFFPPCQEPLPHYRAEAEVDGVRLVAEAGEAPLRLDQGWFERAERLRRHYGPWELARLEAILRLADHVASAEEAGRALIESLPQDGTQVPA